MTTYGLVDGVGMLGQGNYYSSTSIILTKSKVSGENAKNFENYLLLWK